MNYTDKNITLGKVVAGLPQAADIFEEHGIDFCCGGHRLLAQVIEEQGIDKNSLYESLQKADDERKSSYQNQGDDFENMSPVALSAYIDDKHHSYLREALPEASELLNTILRVHGNSHRELFHVYKLFGQLKTDLEQHLLKEETLVFPSYGQTHSDINETRVVIKELMEEHDAAGDILKELRRITNDYNIPDDVCGTFERTYVKLAEIEKDLHRHIHLENNILFLEKQNNQ
ncbi:MAG: hypothetical protein K0R15_1390 [Clostridiales bacterium]|jgi:regulator of cell morphogenesis and NO signaling|nr:hypothetical protein [Clostridiales bacterium]